MLVDDDVAATATTIEHETAITMLELTTRNGE